jgi:hypothetical protein
MMNRFDRILWRINGLLFLALLGFGIFQLILSSIEMRARVAADVDVLPSAERTDKKEVFHLDSPSRVTGISILRMPLCGEVPLTGSSFSSGDGHNWTRNYLFVNYSDLSSWWLFDGFNQRIIEEHDMREEMEGNKKRVVSTIFEVVDSPGIEDHNLAARRPVAAFFATGDGKRVIEIVSPSDRIISVDEVENDQVLIVYQRGSTIMADLFSIQTGAKINESALAASK